MTIRAVSFLLPLVAVAVFAHQASSVDPAEATPPASAATADGGGHAAIQAQYVESRTTSITVNWTVNSTASSSSSSSSFHHDFQVLALSLTSGVVLIARPTNETAFTLTDLTVDTPYKICVVAVASDAKEPLLSSVVALAAGFLEEEEQGSDPDHHHLHHQGSVDRSCLVASTIPYVRLDSVLVFLAVVAFIALLIVAALVCWKRSSASATEDPESAVDDAEGHGGAAGAAGANDDDPGFEEEEKKKGSDEEQPLLDSDNNQYPPPQLGPQKSGGDHSVVVPEVRVESEVEAADRQTSELPADGPADKPIPVV